MRHLEIPGLTRLAIGIAALILGTTVVADGDPVNGQRLAFACAACHGADGNSPSAAFPIIAGQHEAYLLQAMRAYREGSRSDAVMAGAVRVLSEQELEDLAAFYANQTGPGSTAVTARDNAPVTVPDGVTERVVADAVIDAGATTQAVECPEPSMGLDDRDDDGLADRYDAAPDDGGEFVRDTDGNGAYEVCNIHQLQSIQTLGSGAGNSTPLALIDRLSRNYELGQDIDAAELGDFQPIGNCGPENNCMVVGDKFGFAGKFDGKQHIVRNLSVHRPQGAGTALFGVLAKSGKVGNLELADADVTGGQAVGILVGANFGEVFNSRVSGRVSGGPATGALVGGNAGTVADCQASASVTGKDAVGGLVGDMNGIVTGSLADSRVTGNNGVGGLVGLNTFGKVLGSYAGGTVKGTKNVGGLVGVNTDAMVINSFATAAVDGDTTNVGGLVGFSSQSRIQNSYAGGRVSGRDAVGALVGRNNGVVQHSYATGLVSGDSNTGGLVGDNSGGEIIISTWRPVSSAE